MAILTMMRHRFYKNDGTVNAGGKVYTYVAGTTTPTQTYTDSGAGTPNANPIILDSKGEADIWVIGQIKVNVLESDNTQVTGWPVDNIGSGVSNNDATSRWAGTATGSANALSISPSPAISAYAVGQSFIFKASASANTGATTISISGLSAIAVQSNGAACAGGEILANMFYIGVLDTLTTCQITKIGYPTFNNVSMTGTTQVAALTASGLATLNGGVAITGATTSSATAATNTTCFTATGSTTGFNRHRVHNTGGDIRFGVESSTGAQALTGAAAYSSFIGSFTNTPFYLVSNSAIVGTVSSTGLAAVSSTTASAANVYQSASGTDFLRSTSSLRYKRDIEDLQPTYASSALNLRPVWYRSKAAADNQSWSYYGLIAEEVALVEPRLVHWVHEGTKLELAHPAIEAKQAEFDADGNEVSPAIEAQPAGYREVIDTESPLIPDGVQYERLSVLLLKVVQEQQKQIAALEERIAMAGW